MKITVLVDNNTFIDEYYLAEPAVSYWIEVGDFKVLFDLGYSDVFLKNAEKMKIDLKTLDYIVFSHGHNDHTGGLKYFKIHKDTKIVAHPLTFEAKYDDEGLVIGSPFNSEELSNKAHLILTKDVYKLHENFYYLGEIEEVVEQRYAIGTTSGQKDYGLDDSALVYKGKEGLTIITGCSHSGICNIIEKAKKITGKTRIHTVLGGFHLFEVDERLKMTIDYLKNQNISFLYPCHCVSLKAKIAMAKELDIQEVGVGLTIETERSS